MARPKSADPDATRQRIVSAARVIAVRDGMGALSARTIARGAGVSATTVSAFPKSMAGIKAMLVKEAFQPLLHVFKGVDLSRSVSAFDVAMLALEEDPTRAPLVTQVASYAGLRHGGHRLVADWIDECWKVVRDHLVSVELPGSGVQLHGNAEMTANRIIALYFAAAFHLARTPDIDREELRRMICGW